MKKLTLFYNPVFEITIFSRFIEFLALGHWLVDGDCKVLLQTANNHFRA
ncbi:hypothetical protein GFS31_13290 [Leptolyngbya sp. BL0902]|nr:hypothetical protein GFS31_13290 [Leptolyngbya sp. BL0902]